MVPELKCQQNWNVTKTKMLLKLKVHLNLNITKIEISLKLKLVCTTGLSNLTQGVRYWLHWPCFFFSSAFPNFRCSQLGLGQGASNFSSQWGGRYGQWGVKYGRCQQSAVLTSPHSPYHQWLPPGYSALALPRPLRPRATRPPRHSVIQQF